MTAIENAWFKKNGCPVTGASVSSNSLGLESFWGLFLIAGLASLLALIIFVITFLYQHRHIWLGDDPNASTRKRMAILLKIFYQRDNEAFRAMKRSDTRNKSNGFGANATETSLDTHCPASPFTETDSNSSFSGGTRTFSAADYGHANSNGNADAPRVTQH